MTEQTATGQPAAGQPATDQTLTPQDRALLAALNTGRARHADFDLMLPIMDGLAVALYPTGQYPPHPKGMSAEEFVECLYVIAKHADFTADARRLAFAQASQPQGIM